MNHREEQLYLLGLTLKNAIDGLLDKDEEYPNWQWLIGIMEAAAKTNPETASFSPFICQLLPDPRIPF
jgi:hypothetical protein